MRNKTVHTIFAFLLFFGVLYFLASIEKEYVILKKSEVNILLNQCDVVRDDYRYALAKFNPSGSADPQTSCFDSLEEMRGAHEAFGEYINDTR